MVKEVSFKEWKQKAVTGLFNSLDELGLGEGSVGDTSGQVSFFEMQTTDSTPLKVPTDVFVHKLEKSISWNRFEKQTKMALFHSAHDREQILYRILKKYVKAPSILDNPLDGDIQRLHKMNKQVGRDIHKMRAFVRFKKRLVHGKELYLTFYEPDHLILKANAKFFSERFNSMNWIITTPYAQMAWNGDKILYHPGEFHNQDTGPDAFEELWKTYFANIFNPSRVKIKAMKSEMPTRFWKNLPEAELIPGLIRKASERVETMRMNSLKQRPPVRHYLPQEKSLDSLKRSLSACQACPLAGLESRPLLSEGSSLSRIMIIGEAPGDEEEKLGKPFQGPSGQLLDQVLKELGIQRDELYLTNAVKHFKYIKKGKKRLHQTPSSAEIMACRDWLQEEIKLVQPQVILGLGRSAIQSVLGFSMDLKSARGLSHETPWGAKAFFTYHPARILREPDQNKRDILKCSFRDDLRKVLNTDGSEAPQGRPVDQSGH